MTKVIVIVCALAMYGSASAQLDNFVYENCASQTHGPPLSDCAKLLIDKSLKFTQVRDVFEEGLPLDRKADFVSIHSENIPIALPSSGYASKKTWTFRNRKYIKIKQNLSTNFGNYPVTDVIAVVGGIDKIPGMENIEELKGLKVLDSVVMTFWFSEKSGVVAIAFPTKDIAGDAFFCVTKSCLFASFSDQGGAAGGH